MIRSSAADLHDLAKVSNETLLARAMPDRHASRFGVGRVQKAVVASLRERPDALVDDLAVRTGESPNSVKKALYSLHRAGVVTRIGRRWRLVGRPAAEAPVETLSPVLFLT